MSRVHRSCTSHHPPTRANLQHISSPSYYFTFYHYPEFWMLTPPYISASRTQPRNFPHKLCTEYIPHLSYKWIYCDIVTDRQMSKLNNIVCFHACLNVNENTLKIWITWNYYKCFSFHCTKKINLTLWRRKKKR